MAGFDYGRMQGTATRLLTRFAQGEVVLTRTETVPDPDEPWLPGESTTTSYQLKATVSGVAAKLVDGATILATDQQIICAVPAIEPQPTDAVTIDGKSVTIVRVDKLPGAGVTAAYRLIVRG
jgi:hypothetical protein